ncbi:unnamed protein product [Symbiodinium sp. CCMP2592]|nr:unnamed protein product [Symbiodinium sp. CCMP2592]
MAYRGEFSQVPPPSQLDDARPAAAPAQSSGQASSLDGVAPPTLASLLSWTGPKPAATATMVSPAPFAALPPSSTTSGSPAAAPLPASTSAVPPTTQPAPTVTSLVPATSELAASTTNRSWSVVDSQMLMEALRASSDVVIEQMLQSVREMDVTEPTGEPVPAITQGPMQEIVPAAVPMIPAVPSSSGMTSPVSLTPPPSPKTSAPTPKAPGASGKVCTHSRTTTKGTNQHYHLKTCKDCGKVLEREKKQPSAKAAPGSASSDTVYPKKPEDCKHENEHDQTVPAPPMAYPIGVSGSHAQQIMDLAATVVQVQESGGMPVPVERLNDIVNNCTRVYLQRLSATLAFPSQTAPPTAGGTAKAAPPTPQAQVAPSTATAAAPAANPLPHGMDDDTVLHSGKHKGRTYREVYENFPDYCAWILSQGGTLQAHSLQNFSRYLLARRGREHQSRATANMAVDDVPSEDCLLAVLDTGCNQTCHGARWMKSYMAPAQGSSLKGIGGRVRALGKRELHICLQLSDGTLAKGTVTSTELEESEAPLLLSYGAQKQLGMVIDAERNTVFSKLFRQEMEVIDRDGLPALRLLPLMDEEPSHFAMSAEATEPPQPTATEEEEESDYWEQLGDVLVRVHVRPRNYLYDPVREPSDDKDYDHQLPDYPFRRTVAINTITGEKVEFQDHWQKQAEIEDVTEEIGGQWHGQTFFYKSLGTFHREGSLEPESPSLAAHAKFDEERPASLSKGQKRQIEDHSQGVKRLDTTLWHQLGRQSQRHRVRGLLPRGCRCFLLEIFAGAAAMTAAAVGWGMPVAAPIDLELDQGNLLNPAVRDKIWERVEAEDPYITVVRRHELGRQVIVESPWWGLFWKLRCIERLTQEEHPATGQSMDVLYLDHSKYERGGAGRRPSTRLSGILTASEKIKGVLGRVCGPGPAAIGSRPHHRHVGGISSPWATTLCDSLVEAAYEELVSLSSSVVFAAEDEAEEHEEFGPIDAINQSEDEGDLLPPPVSTEEVRREEGLEEDQEAGQPEFEKERRRKWLLLERPKRLALRRLHQMTGHASNEAMARMLRSAGSEPATVTACKYFRCQACLDRKKPDPPRAVAEPPPFRFNHQVGCDAFEVVDAKGERHTILSLVDEGTKFHVAGRVSAGGTPSSKACADFLNHAWLAWAGPPKLFKCDQGVHNKGKVASLLRSLGVEIKQAGVKAPWQVGRVERHGGILKQMVKRVISQHHVSGEFAVSAVVSQCAATKNSSYLHEGYVPAQWVLGKIPSDVTSLLSEAAGTQLGIHQMIDDPQDEFGQRLLTRQWAKEAFVYVDTSQRIRKAMLRQSHPIRGPYQTGDLVNYFRRGRWFGPARVLSNEGKSSLWLVHSGMTVLISDTCCRPATVEDIRRKQALELRPGWPSNRPKRKFRDTFEDDLENLPFSGDLPEEEDEAPNQFFDFVGELPSSSTSSGAPATLPALAPPQPALPAESMEMEAPSPGESVLDMPGDLPERQVTQPEQEPHEVETSDAAEASPPTENPASTSTSGGSLLDEAMTQPASLPAENPSSTSTSGGPLVTQLQSALRRSVDQVDGHIRSRSPSRAPAAPPGLGHLASAPEHRNVIAERKLAQATTAQKKVHAFLAQRGEKKYRKKVQKQGKGREIMYQHASEEVKKQLDETRRKEWDNWKGYSNMRKITPQELEAMKKENPNLRVIATRWVDIDSAEKGEQPKYKSRFVVRGDLEDSTDMRTDSPTGSQVGMGLVISYAAATRKNLNSGDISAAFLQGSVLDRQLVLRMPKPQGSKVCDYRVMIHRALCGRTAV